MTSVLIVTLTRRLGGAERMIAQLLDGFRDPSRFTLGLVTTEGEKRREPVGETKTKGKPAEESVEPSSGDGIPWDGPTVGLREILFGRYDIIHSHLFLPGLLIRLRRIWDGSFRWVHTVHYGEAAYGSMSLGRFRRWIDRSFVFPHADRIVAVSPSIAEEIGAEPHLRLVENAIPLEPDRSRTREPPSAGERDATESARGWNATTAAEGRNATTGAEGRNAAAVAKPVILGTVARLRKEKGIDDLLEAVRILVDRGRRVRLRIAGDGKEATALRDRAHELDLDDVVEFCGFVDDVDSFYRSLDIYVQPSRMESFGIAALESMRFSLPLVARSVGNLPRLLGEGEFGILVDPGNPRDADGRRDPHDPRARHGPHDPNGPSVPGHDAPTALADAVERAMANPEEYRERARHGLEHWRSRYDPERMVRAHQELYREVTRPAVCMMSPIVTHSTGGIQRQLLLQSRELVRRGHRVFLVQRSDPTLEADPGKADRWRHATILGTGRLGGTRAGPGGVLQRLRGIAFIGVGLVRLWQLRRRVQVLHAHQLHSPTLLGVLGKRLLLKPLVAKVTSSGEMGEGSEIRRLPFSGARIRALRDVDRMLVLTPHMAAEVKALGVPSERIRIVPNSVEIPEEPAGQPRSAAARVSKTGPAGPGDPGDPGDRVGRVGPTGQPGPGGIGDPSAPFRLLFVGRLSTEKRVEDLLAAARRLAKEGWTLEVELVGAPDPDRDAEPRLRKMAAEMAGDGAAETADDAAAETPDDSTAGTADDGAAETAGDGVGGSASRTMGEVTVHFRGHHPDVEPFYRSADAFVLPSSTEGLSNSLLEAMAHGLPCLVSDIPQNRFAVAEAGILFSVGSPEELADAVRRLLKDREDSGELIRRLSAAARERAEREFSLESVVDRLEGVYDEVTLSLLRASSGDGRAGRA